MGSASLELWECSRKAPQRDVQIPGWSRELGWSSWGPASPTRVRAQSIPSAVPSASSVPAPLRGHRDLSHLGMLAESPGLGQGQTLPFPPRLRTCPTAQTSSQDHPPRGGCGWTSPGLTAPGAQRELPVSFWILPVFCLLGNSCGWSPSGRVSSGRALSSALCDIQLPQSCLSQLLVCKGPH